LITIFNINNILSIVFIENKNDEPSIEYIEKFNFKTILIPIKFKVFGVGRGLNKSVKLAQ